LQGDLLCVVAFSKLPIQPYAAGSHVWKDLESKNKDEPFFKVNGIETEPQIALRALRTIYIAATELGCDLFWLDKQCVTLTDIDSGKDLHDVVLSFTKALLEKGYRADWLDIAPSMGPSLRVSAMPVLPIGDDDGVA